MAIELTDVDFQNLAVRAEQQGEQIYQPMALGIQGNLPRELGAGSDRIFKLRNGLTICIRCGRLEQDIKHTRQHEPRFSLTAKFYLSGRSRVRTLDASDIDPDYEETKGCHYLYHLPNHTEVEEWSAEQQIHVVMVCVDPDYFGTFDADKTALSLSLRKLFEGDETQRFHQPLGQMTPAIKQLLQQILHCPYTGLMQQLYLESKALELLVAQFATWADARSPLFKASVFLCPQDIEQLHHAKGILEQRVGNPPSLPELARLVGLNDRKLKQGFRQLFGTTVFGYLRDYRMQQAQQLLQSSHMTIAKVAASVGYRNSEAFSTAFRRKFAVSPKVYQLRQLR